MKLVLSLCSLMVISMLFSNNAFANNSQSEKDNIKDGNIAAQEILDLKDKDFMPPLKQLLFEVKYNHVPISSAKLWQLFNKTEKAYGLEIDFSMMLYSYIPILEVITSNDEPGTSEQLIQLYDRLNDVTNLQDYIVTDVTNLWIKHKLKSLIDSGKQINLNLTPSETPIIDELDSADAELKSAWKLYRSIDSDYQKAIKPEDRENKISFIDSEKKFYTVIVGFLRGKEANLLEKMTSFTWGSWCGTGSERFNYLQKTAIFMAALKDQRYALAIAAKLTTSSRQQILPDSISVANDHLFRKFLKQCNIDWETLYVGTALEINRELLLQISAYGTSKGADLLIKMSQLPKFKDDTLYLNAVGGLISPGKIVGSDYHSEFSLGGYSVERKAKDSIDNEQQQKLLQILCSKIKVDAGYTVLEATIELLYKLHRPESKAALLRATQFPYQRVCDKAFDTLELMGVKVAIDKTILPQARFRLLVNGKTINGETVNYDLESVKGNVSSGSKIDDNGVCVVSRDYLVDSARPVTKVSFYSNHSFYADPIAQTQGLIFRVSCDRPTDLNEITDVDVHVTSLTLKIDRLKRPEIADGEFLITLIPTTKESYGVLGFGFKVPASGEVVFPQLQDGKYDIVVKSSGFENYKISNVVLNGEPKIVDVPLTIGGDLKFTIIAPGGDDRDKRIYYEMWRNEEKFSYSEYYDYRAGGLRGLPPGNYRLKIFSSAEKLARDNAMGISANKNNSFVPYQGAEYNFTVDAGSPAIIDLGKIELHTE